MMPARGLTGNKLLGVLYRGIGPGIPLITQFLMNLSTVVIPLATMGWSATLMCFSPLIRRS
jgi:hypothetical protein